VNIYNTYNETQDFYVFCDGSEIGFGGHLTTGSEDEPVEIYGSWAQFDRMCHAEFKS
jgi:hypothetical protein